MKMLSRWGRFNLVGAMGMGVQLTVLSLLNRWIAEHYLFSSAVAVEFALLHNFAWHLRYTWSDRRDGSSCLAQLVRFHLSNGLVSMLGNLVLMRQLVHGAHLPPLVANIIAVLCCSLANFCLGNSWAFSAEEAHRLLKRGPSKMRARLIAIFIAWVILSTMASAQTTSSTPPDAPVQRAPVRSPAPSNTYTNLYGAGVFCGICATTSSVTTKPAVGCGAGMTFIPLPLFVELGVMGPQANRSYLSGYISLDSSIPIAHPKVRYLPLVIVGYSRLFETGHALDYGLGLSLPRSNKSSNGGKSLRNELRDYRTFATPLSITSCSV